MSFRIDDGTLFGLGLKTLKILNETLCQSMMMGILKPNQEHMAKKFYTNFCGLNVLKDDIECECFTVISIDSLLVYESKYYLQAYLDNCVYKIVNIQMTGYLDENVFED